MMSDLNTLFRRRIGFSQEEVLTFEKLNTVLEKTAKRIPFENLCIIANETAGITKENLIRKIITRNEGGLCYELNSIFYLFLVDNGFDAALVRGVIYDHAKQQWSVTGKTHAAILLKHAGQLYLVDTGFGGNLPLKPVPLNGEAVTSGNGEFRVEQTDTEHGDYLFYMKLKHKDKEWRVGYAFNSVETIGEVSKLNEMQTVIVEHPESPFNKKPLITRLTDRGNITLSGNVLTEWTDGKAEKREVKEEVFEETVRTNFR